MNKQISGVGIGAVLAVLASAAPASAQLLSLFKPSALEVLHSFGAPANSGPLDGIYPEGGLIRADDGRFYGTTTQGGKYGRDPLTLAYGYGTVFSIDTQSRYAQLYSFHHVNDDLSTNVDGIAPGDGLLEGADGALYGVAPGSGPNGNGDVFRLTRDGQSFTVLHAFLSPPDESAGGQPESGLAQAPNGELFGGTDRGGTGSPDNGVLYRLDADGGDYRVLHSYTNDGNGSFVGAKPLIASDGRIYGYSTGLGTAEPGTLFRVEQDGSNYTLLHTFDSRCYFYYVGFDPGLVQGPDGLLYGACLNGGTNGGGALFRIATDGSGFQILHDFAASKNGTLTTASDGSIPESSLQLGADGYFYGTTLQGGSAGNGTIYRLRPDGSGYQLLESFPRFTLPTRQTNKLGAFPTGDIAFGDDGKLYGVTSRGGKNATGVIWRFTPPAVQ